VSAALWIWTVTLVVVTFVVVPLALYLLHRTLQAASAIERYTRESLEAGAGIARNTEAVKALDQTIAAAGSLLEASQKLRDRTQEIARAVEAGKE
jgi:hypothetical protein